MTPLSSRLGAVCALLFGVTAACGARTGLPLPVCVGTPLKTVSGPNLYFVLDRSKSMEDPANPADPASESKWTIVGSDISALITAVGSEAQFGAAEFPSADNECGAGSEVMPLQRGDGLPATTPGSAANVFQSATGAPRSGGTPTAATFLALAPELTSFKGHTFAILATDGGPNCNMSPGLMCGAETCTANIDELHCPVPGDPSTLFECARDGVNCCETSPFLCAGGLNCLDDTRTVDAISALAHPAQGTGVPTFVIGIPGSDFEPYPEVLDRMAIAGGTARATEPFYYQVNTADSKSLVNALAEIAAQIAATCAIELEEPPADPAEVNVLLNGRIVPEGANGWTISGSLVTVLGATCDQVHAAGHAPIVTSGCPTVTSTADAGSAGPP